MFRRNNSQALVSYGALGRGRRIPSIDLFTLVEIMVKGVWKLLVYGIPALMWGYLIYVAIDLLIHFKDPGEFVWAALVTKVVIGLVMLTWNLKQDTEKVRRIARQVIDDAGVTVDQISAKTRETLVRENNYSFFGSFSYWFLMGVLMPMTLLMVLVWGLFHGS